MNVIVIVGTDGTKHWVEEVYRWQPGIADKSLALMGFKPVVGELGEWISVESDGIIFTATQVDVWSLPVEG